MLKVFCSSITIVFTILFSSSVCAHVKWFVPLDEALPSEFVRYKITDLEVVVWVAVALFMLVSSVLLDSLLPKRPSVGSEVRHKLYVVLRVATGVSLFFTAFSGAVIAPHFSGDGTVIALLLIIEFSIAVCFVANFFVFYAAVALCVMFMGAIFQFGGYIFEYVNLLGIAVYIMIHGYSKGREEARVLLYAVPALRVLTGVALIILGFTEKLLYAEYGELFIHTYQWNFMQELGVSWFSDRLLVLSAGMMEVVFGSILILGSTTRINILVLSAFMITSNVAFFMVGNIENGAIEFVGHLPVVATALLLLVMGSGQKITVMELIQYGSARLLGTPVKDKKGKDGLTV